MRSARREIDLRQGFVIARVNHRVTNQSQHGLRAIQISGFQQRAGYSVWYRILFWIARIYFFSEVGRLGQLAAIQIQAQQHRRRFAAGVAVR